MVSTISRHGKIFLHSLQTDIEVNYIINDQALLGVAFWFFIFARYFHTNTTCPLCLQTPSPEYHLQIPDIHLTTSLGSWNSKVGHHGTHSTSILAFPSSVITTVSNIHYHHSQWALTQHDLILWLYTTSLGVAGDPPSFSHSPPSLTAQCHTMLHHGRSSPPSLQHMPPWDTSSPLTPHICLGQFLQGLNSQWLFDQWWPHLPLGLPYHYEYHSQVLILCQHQTYTITPGQACPRSWQSCAIYIWSLFQHWGLLWYWIQKKHHPTSAMTIDDFLTSFLSIIFALTILTGIHVFDPSKFALKMIFLLVFPEHIWHLCSSDTSSNLSSNSITTISQCLATSHHEPPLPTTGLPHHSSLPPLSHQLPGCQQLSSLHASTNNSLSNQNPQSWLTSFWSPLPLLHHAWFQDLHPLPLAKLTNYPQTTPHLHSAHCRTHWVLTNIYSPLMTCPPPTFLSIWITTFYPPSHIFALRTTKWNCWFLLSFSTPNPNIKTVLLSTSSDTF